jgi:hypothetical protein
MRFQLLRYGLLIGAAGCVRPATQQDLYIAQALVDIQDALNELRTTTYELQDRVDSLRMVVAQRDSVITRLAVQAGIPLPP